MTGLEKLHQLSGLLRDQRLADLRNLMSREDALRREIANIFEMRKTAFQASGDAAAMRQQLGADQAWHDWLGRRVATLNLELAQVLARKESLQIAARRAVAQDETLAELDRKARQDARAKRLAVDERKLEQLYLKKGWIDT